MSVHHRDLDKALFVKMLRAGHVELRRGKDTVNALNVFPVPDGDTGTNMYLSLTAGIEQVARLGPDSTLGQAAHALAEGLLMGARGNSGVILSQLFRGFSTQFHGLSTVDSRGFAAALSNGVEIAYQKVSRPVEGTILTVAREAASAAASAAKGSGSTVNSVMRAALERSERALARTPSQLPILRQANVVDSGGQGLVYIYRGFLQALGGEELDGKEMEASENETFAAAGGVVSPLAAAGAAVHGEGEYGYCTEFVVRPRERAPDEVESALLDSLPGMGDSLLVVAGGTAVKVHLHTLNPGNALEEGLRYGDLVRIKIDNMTEQHHSLMWAVPAEDGVPEAGKDRGTGEGGAPERRHCGLVAVASGSGLEQMFYSAGADVVVSGGQGMNPSTEDLVAAVRSVDADRVILLPNNPNVVLAAEQAMSVIGERLRVVETRSVPQGLGAALAFRKDAPSQENEAHMRLAMQRIVSGAVTRSVRDSGVGGHSIARGDYIGLQEGEIVAVDRVRSEVLRVMLERLCAGNREICTVFCADEGSLEEARAVARMAQTLFPQVELEIQHGGQPLYDYLMAVE